LIIVYGLAAHVLKNKDPHCLYRYVATQVFISQTSHIAFVVAFGRPPKFIFEQVMALQLAERLGTFALAITQYLGYSNPGVVVQNGLRHSA
jgi:hypothetical protein